jgi:hypothetical protein
MRLPCPIPAAQLTIDNLGGTVWRVSFPRQTANGPYQYAVGPHLANLFGSEMSGAFSGAFVVNQASGPDLLSAMATGATLRLAMPSQTGKQYRVLRSIDLVHWQALGSPTPGDGTTLSWSLALNEAASAFFRLQIDTLP